MTSLYKLAEQCKYLLNGGNMQALIASVIDCYSSAVKKEWYENKAEDFASLDGAFIYTYGKDNSLVPEVEESTGMYCITIPSSYVRLPGEYGINQVSFIKGQVKPFIRIEAGSIGMWSNQKAYCLGGSQTYFTEGIKMYFPKMTNTSTGNMMLKLAVAYDGVDVDEPLNIPRSVADAVVNMVVAKFAPKPQTEEKIKV